MKYLIAGLGNVGADYENTRHNIGFQIADTFARSEGVFFSSDRLAFRTVVKIKGRTLIIIKPTTFMNLSGKAVNYWMQAEKISIENLLVLTDDIALPFGTIRLRGKGSDGGHNGLNDIQETLNTIEYARLRFGVGNDFAKGRQVEYVLGKWSDEQNKTLNERIGFAVDAVKSFVSIGLSRTMTEFNKK
ncbi:MAG: aminoacyl-tRNA hydrolase [Bacteroidia bacterium]